MPTIPTHPLPRLWRTAPALTATGLLMTVALLAFTAGVWLDPRTVSGAPAWMKPAKFAASTAIYAFTLAWIFTLLPAWPRMQRVVGRTTVIVFLIEVAIIALQAWRGTTSHFNVSTPLDATLFTIMGSSIVLQTIVSVAVAVALWRQPFADRALGWALRLGMAITIAGAASGGLMTRPTDAQLAALAPRQHLTASGAHTVGAPDGGAGLPGTGWSRTHGDLRVPHFLGLHAVQILPALVVLLGRRQRDEWTRVARAIAGATSYALLFALLTWQALRGQSVLRPDALTLDLFAAWLILTTAAVLLTARRHAAEVRTSAHAAQGRGAV